MKQFFKYVLATITGILLLSFVCFLFLLFVGAVSSLGGGDDIKSNSVLHLKLNKSIQEQDIEDPFEKLSFSGASALGLNSILRSLKNAESDDKIKGIYLELTNIPAGMVTIQEIRDAIQSVKDAGKFVVAYGEGFTQKAYYLGSVADEIYLNPSGLMELKGFSSERMFLKGALEKLEVTPNIFWVGDYKSATETFRRENMSEESKEQTLEILNDFHDRLVTTISESRNLSLGETEAIINEYKIRSVEDAVQYGIIDGAMFYDQVEDKMREKLNLTDGDDKVNFVSLGKYSDSFTPKKNKAKDRVAIVYAQGEIVGGEGDLDQIGSDRYAEILRKIREDDKVKALVLRVNSPGGSGLASDVIWREIEKLKENGVAVVASMGDVAASGGYFISCNADKILAEETTITGSIGVFGFVPTVENFFKNKLGITFDRVGSAPNADMLSSLNRELTDQEKTWIQDYIDNFYEVFVNKVKDGRGKTYDEIHAVAQGRVWTGVDALERGLVDEIGGIEEAIDLAAELAGLTEYKIKEYPKKQDPFEMILKKLQGETQMQEMLKSELGEYYTAFKMMSDWENKDFVQARMPFELMIR